MKELKMCKCGSCAINISITKANCKDGWFIGLCKCPVCNNSSDYLSMAITAEEALEKAINNWNNAIEENEN